MLHSPNNGKFVGNDTEEKGDSSSFSSKFKVGDFWSERYTIQHPFQTRFTIESTSLELQDHEH